MSQNTSKKDRKNGRDINRDFNKPKKYQHFLEKEEGIYYGDKKCPRHTD